MVSTGRPVSHRSALTALCVTEIVSYGVLYYAFAVMAPAIAEDTGWSQAATVSAFSAGSIAGALVGILVGRFIQAHGPRLVMTLAGLLGGVAVAGIALAPTLPWFTFWWLLAGIASSGLFYPPAFAALTHWYGDRSVRAITTLTLAAGFASTIFAPLSAALLDELGWRRAYLVLAALLLVVTVPAHALALRLPWVAASASGHGSASTEDRGDRSVLISRSFVLVTTAGTLTSFAMYASLVNLPPLLLEKGVDLTLAAWMLGLGGAAQVAGRLGYPWLDQRLDARTRGVLVISALAAAVALLGVAPGVTALLVAGALLAGVARGLFTLVGATVVSDYWGRARYAALNGTYHAPLGVAAASAPGLGAALAAAVGSYAVSFVALAAVAAVGAGAAFLAGPPGQGRRP